MAERPIHLDARDISGRMGSQANSSRQQPGQPSPQDAQRFARALQGQGDSPAAAAPAAASPAAPLPTFPGLMAHAAASAQAAPVTQKLETLRQDLSQLVGRLMVGDGSASAGGRSLMMDLSDEMLPGVTVSVFEDAGAWVAEFRCREEAPFVLLAESATQMASRLADSLGQDAVWRVVSEGLSPGGAWDRLVNNQTDGSPSTEAFASCAHARR